MICTIVKVSEDGTIKIPDEIWQEAGLARPDEVKVEVNAHQITLVPTPEETTAPEDDRENLKRIRELIHETFADIDWQEIHRARKDR